MEENIIDKEDDEQFTRGDVKTDGGTGANYFKRKITHNWGSDGIS